MEQWYILKRGKALNDTEIANMTAEERSWWIDRIKRENEEIEEKSKSGNLSF